MLAAGVALSGCSSGSLGGLTPDWFPSMPGFSRVSSTPADGTALASAPSMEDNCPIADVRAGAGTLAVATKTQQATANDVRYQLTFMEIARQCALAGNVIRMRVGVQGRAIAGPAGAPSQLDVPLRYAVVREGAQPRTVVTKFKRIQVVIGPDQSHVQFVDVEDALTFPMPPGSELDAYVIYVGFDEIGDKNEKKPAKTAKKPAQRQQ